MTPVCVGRVRSVSVIISSDPEVSEALAPEAVDWLSDADEANCPLSARFGGIFTQERFGKDKEVDQDTRLRKSDQKCYEWGRG